MSIIKQYHKDTGITYVYESESYWDKEKKQPRSRRKLIGKLDNETGEIVPTERKNTSQKDNDPQNNALTKENTTLRQKIKQLERELTKVKEHSRKVEIENQSLRDRLNKIGEILKTI